MSLGDKACVDLALTLLILSVLSKLRHWNTLHNQGIRSNAAPVSTPLTPTQALRLTNHGIDVRTALSLGPSVVPLSFLDVFQPFNICMTISPPVR